MVIDNFKVHVQNVVVLDHFVSNINYLEIFVVLLQSNFECVEDHLVSLIVSSEHKHFSPIEFNYVNNEDVRVSRIVDLHDINQAHQIEKLELLV